MVNVSYLNLFSVFYARDISHICETVSQMFSLFRLFLDYAAQQNISLGISFPLRVEHLINYLSAHNVEMRK